MLRISGHYQINESMYISMWFYLHIQYIFICCTGCIPTTPHMGVFEIWNPIPSLPYYGVNPPFFRQTQSPFHNYVYSEWLSYVWPFWPWHVPFWFTKKAMVIHGPFTSMISHDSPLTKMPLFHFANYRLEGYIPVISRRKIHKVCNISQFSTGGLVIGWFFGSKHPDEKWRFPFQWAPFQWDCP